MDSISSYVFCPFHRSKWRGIFNTCSFPSFVSSVIPPYYLVRMFERSRKKYFLCLSRAFVSVVSLSLSLISLEWESCKIRHDIWRNSDKGVYNHSSSSHSYDHNSRHKILLITDTRLHKVALYTQLMQERHRPKSSDHKGCGVKTWTTLDGFVAEHLEEVRGQISETHIMDNVHFREK